MENIINKNEIDALNTKIEILWDFYKKEKDNILIFQYESLKYLFNNFAKKWIYFSLANFEWEKSLSKEYSKTYILRWWSWWKSKDPFVAFEFWKFKILPNKKLVTYSFHYNKKYFNSDSEIIISDFNKIKYGLWIKASDTDQKKYPKLEKFVDIIIKDYFQKLGYDVSHRRYHQFITLDDISLEFNRITKILNDLDLWTLITKDYFVKELNKRLDILIKNIDLKTYSNNKISDKNSVDIVKKEFKKEGNLIFIYIMLIVFFIIILMYLFI